MVLSGAGAALRRGGVVGSGVSGVLPGVGAELSGLRAHTGHTAAHAAADIAAIDGRPAEIGGRWAEIGGRSPVEIRRGRAEAAAVIHGQWGGIQRGGAR